MSMLDETVYAYLLEIDVPLRQSEIMAYYIGIWADLGNTALLSAPLPPMVRLHFADQLEGFHHRIFAALPLADVQAVAKSLNEEHEAMVPGQSGEFGDAALMSPDEYAGFIHCQLDGLRRCFLDYEERWGHPFSPFIMWSEISKLSRMIEAVIGDDGTQSSLERLEKEGGDGVRE